MALRGPERRDQRDEADLPGPPESGPSASDLRTPNDRIVSSKRDVRVFHKGNFPSSRSFLIYLDRSKLDPFTNVLPRTTLDPPLLVTRVVRLALQVLLRSTRAAKGRTDWAHLPATPGPEAGDTEGWGQSPRPFDSG